MFDFLCVTILTHCFYKTFSFVPIDTSKLSRAQINILCFCMSNESLLSPRSHKQTMITKRTKASVGHTEIGP